MHEYLDLRLAGREVAAIESHLADCPACQQLQREYSMVQEILSERISLPEAASGRFLRRVKKRAAWRRPVEAFREYAKDVQIAFRDLDWNSAMARLAGLPVTVCFFAILISQFPVVQFGGVMFPTMSIQGWTTSAQVQPLAVETFATRQGRARFKDLMDTAWRLPYEDSLSLVAEITPEGHAEIGDVLEYPKSDALFNAVDAALRTSEWIASESGSRPQVIFSFQKIDVWSNQQGL
jgi:hypothetical protein